MMATHTKTLEQAIEEIGVGRFQKKLLIICGLGWAADAMEVIIIAFVLPAVIGLWGLSGAQAGWLTPAIFIGMAVGAIFWGRLSDRIGRKVGFQATIAIDSIFGLLSAFSPNFIFLFITRVITGFGIGGTLPVDYSIFAEYLPKEKRGRWLVILEGFWAVGHLVLAIAAWLVFTNISNPNLNWRLLLALSAVPGLLILPIRRFIPESPRYLLINGREEEARAVLHRVAEENGVDLQLDKLVAQPRAPKVPLTTLLAEKFRTRTVMLWVAWFTIAFGYYGTLIWLPRIFGELGFSTPAVYQNQVIIALVQIPGYISAAVLIEKWGRKQTLSVYLALSAVFTYVFALLAGMSPVAAVPVVLATSLMTFFTLGAWGTLYAYTPELYPTEIRATGMGAASSMARYAGILAPFLGAQIWAATQPGGLVIALTMFAIAFAIGAVVVLVLGRETRGQALEETLDDVPLEGGTVSREAAK
jgi:putative MFS transporter